MNKYFPLLIAGVLFALIFKPVVDTKPVEWSADFFFTIVLFLSGSGFCVYIFYKLKGRWKIVALNRWKIVVGIGKNEKEYSWLDVKSISLIGWVSSYTLHLKNGEEILFTTHGTLSLFTGDGSEMGIIISKMKRELSL